MINTKNPKNIEHRQPPTFGLAEPTKTVGCAVTVDEVCVKMGKL